MNPFKFLVSFVILSLLGCSDPNEPESSEEGPSPVPEEKTTFVSVEQATGALCEFMELLGAETRSGRPRRIAEVVTLGGFAETRAAGSTQDEPLVYLFNFADDEGFALVSGDSRVGDVLAFVEEGNLDPEVGTDNPGFAIFLSRADTYYRLKTGLPVYDADGNLVVLSDDDDGYDPDIDEDYVEYSDWYNYYEAGERLACQWGQGLPLNKHCSLDWDDEEYENVRPLVGCAAVAVGQIMYHYGYDYTYNGTAYDWDVIRKFQTRPLDYWNESHVLPPELEEPADMAARLLADLGRSENLDMYYIPGHSGASSENVPRTFRNFGYTKVGELVPFRYSHVLMTSRPTFVCGNAFRHTTLANPLLGIHTDRVSYSEGHAWVIDTNLHQRKDKYTYRYDGVLLKTEYEDRYFVHCNWGWWGSKDGYYAEAVFDTNAGPVMRTTIDEGQSHYYRYNLEMITNIRP